MARTSVWRSAPLIAAVAIAGCNESLTTACRSPALCPSGGVQLADTLLTSPVVSDTSVRGYQLVREAGFLFVASLDSLKSVALIRFSAVSPDTFRVAGDTALKTAAAPPDSIVLSLHIGQRDTSAKQLSLIIYRIPARFDTTITYAQAQAFFADPLVVDTAPIPDTLNNAALSVRMPLSLIAAPEDSGVISLGVKLIGPTPTGLGIASANPSLSYFVHAVLPDTNAKRSLGVGPAFETFLQTPDPAQIVSGVLAVGGIPSARSTLHLSLPKVVVDSNAIVRATLILNTVHPVVGFVQESFYVVARPMLRDFGLKALLYPDSSIAGHTLMHQGDSGTVQVDIAPILRLWGTTRGDSLPRAIILLVFPEGSVLAEADFKGRAAGVAGGAPQLRVTYVKRYHFDVP